MDRTWNACTPQLTVFATVAPSWLLNRASAAEQVQRQGQRDGERAEHRDEHAGGRAILGDADGGVVVRMQRIGEPLERGVEQLGRNHDRAREQHQRPPQRARAQDAERRQRRRQSEQLDLQAALRAHAVHETLQREAQACTERLILVQTHRLRAHPVTGSLPVPIRCRTVLSAAVALLLAVLLVGEVGGALWEGGEDRFGRTLWHSIDATLIGGVSSEVLKRVFSRQRPDTTSDPNHWFKGGGNQSLP